MGYLRRPFRRPAACLAIPKKPQAGDGTDFVKNTSDGQLNRDNARRDIVDPERLMGDEIDSSKPGHGTLSHPWPGSPLHQRASTRVPGPGPPRTVRHLPL
jgi:hypothetical protein